MSRSKRGDATCRAEHLSAHWQRVRQRRMRGRLVFGRRSPQAEDGQWPVVGGAVATRLEDAAARDGLLVRAAVLAQRVEPLAAARQRLGKLHPVRRSHAIFGIVAVAVGERTRVPRRLAGRDFRDEMRRDELDELCASIHSRTCISFPAKK